MKKIIVLCAMLMITAAAYSDGVHSNDAFVLVDVSGTMKDTETNDEAKDIIENLLLGTFNSSYWERRNWRTTLYKEIPSSSILKNGSRFCIIPFGNEDRVRDRQKCLFQNSNSFKTFYSYYYPKGHSDQFTYLDFAMAFVGSVAISDTISKAYLFVYTDGLNESKRPLNSINQQIEDYYQAVKKTNYDRVGFLRKYTSSGIHYDIQIWEFTSFETLDEKGVKGFVPPKENPKLQTIRIIEPKDGRTKTSPHKVSKNEEWKLNWSGGSGNVIVYKKEGDAFNKIPPNKSKEIYSKSGSGTSVKLTFFNSADYKVEVRGVKGGSDSIFLRVTTPVAPMLFKLLIIAGFIVGAMYASKKLSGRGSNQENNTRETHRSTPKNDPTDYKSIYN